MIKKITKEVRCFIAFLALLFISLIFISCSNKKVGFKNFKSLDDLKNCTFAISDSNSGYEKDIERELPGVSFARYTNYFDTFIAVTEGNADAAFTFKYTFVGLKESYPSLEYVESNFEIPIVANFSEDNDALREDFNLFIAESRQNGLLDKLVDKWLYRYYELTDEDVVVFSDLNENSKSIKFALNNDNIPYEYLKNGMLTGFEPALFYEFCKAREYKPEIFESRYDAVITGLASGKYDMAMGGYGYTNERSENSNFSDPYFMDKVVYTVNGKTKPKSFFERLKGSFERTFIKQDRWKLFVDGMLVTLFITMMSVLLGSIFGLLLFLISNQNKFLTKILYKINDTLEALPILVVLMIFYYIVFGKSNISGILVAIIVFGINFAFTFFALLRNNVNAIPIEQTEAGLALGYSKWQTFLKIVLPQALEFFIPSIKSAIVATLKSTAIVGYVAVQDLTKSGDIVRSQTFEAFLPIITVAILYFLLAKVLILLLNHVLISPSKKRRARKDGK